MLINFINVGRKSDLKVHIEEINMVLKTTAINEDIITKTTRCTKKFSCLAGDRDDLCNMA